MFNFFKKSDSEVSLDVLNELMWDPNVNSSQIKVTAIDGIVTLTGTVPHYVEKLVAEHAAQRVGGVRGVVDELEIKGIFVKSDIEIARLALNVLKWNYSVPEDIKVAVEKGWLTLEGEAAFEHEKNAAHDAVEQILSVRGVTNNIKIKSRPHASEMDFRMNSLNPNL